jgi:O-antigen ligase
LQLVSVSTSDQAARFTGPLVTPASVLRFTVLLLVIASLGFLPVLDLGSRKAPIFVNDILVMASLAVGLIAISRARALKLDNVALAALAFAAIGGLSAISALPRFGLSAFQVAASLAYLARWLVYFGIYLLVINCVRRDSIGKIWDALQWTMLVFAAFGIVQSIFLPNFGQMVFPDARPYLDLDPQGHRLMSTMLEPNVAAAMILTVLLPQIALLASGVRVAPWKPALLFIALVLTLSRSGALGFVCGGFVILAALGLRKRMVRFLAVICTLLIAALPPLLQFADQYGKLGVSDKSAGARVVVWQGLLGTFLEHPWFGIGFNTYGFYQQRRGVELYGGASYSAEGGLLFIAVMTGVVGLAVYGLMLWFVMTRCRSVWRDRAANAEERGLCVGAAAVTIAICVHSIFVNTLIVPFVVESLWLLWGFAFLIASALRQRTVSAPSSAPRAVLTVV